MVMRVLNARRDDASPYESRKAVPLAKNAILIAYRALSDLAGKGSLFLITIAAAHRLSQQSFGIFALASALGWIAAVSTDFGIQLHVARAVARRPEAAHAILKTWLQTRLWTALAAIALIAAGLIVWSPGPAYAAPMLLFALVYVSGGLIEFLHYFYRGLGRSDVESTLTLWQRLATLGCAMLALAWRPTLTWLAVAMLVPAVSTLLFSVGLAARLGRRAGAGSAGRSTSFWTGIFPIGAGIVLSALYFRIDLFLVQRWSGTEAVALYNAVFRLIEALRLFPAAVLAVVLPSLCRATDHRPLARVAVGVMAFAVPITAALWMGAAWGVPLLYGARYAAAIPAFRILALCFPFFSLNYALTHQLIGWDGQRDYAIVCALALAANLALNARLIPALSIEGAAWATLWTEAVVTAGCGAALWMRGAPAAPDVATAAAS
jgi:O-antigen/teichoic acid export membrane protein